MEEEETAVLLEALYGLTSGRDKYVCNLYYGRYWLLIRNENNEKSYYLETNEVSSGKEHLLNCLRFAVSQRLRPDHSMLVYLKDCYEVVNFQDEIHVVLGPIGFRFMHWLRKLFKK